MHVLIGKELQLNCYEQMALILRKQYVQWRSWQGWFLHVFTHVAIIFAMGEVQRLRGQ